VVGRGLRRGARCPLVPSIFLALLKPRAKPLHVFSLVDFANDKRKADDDRSPPMTPGNTAANDKSLQMRTRRIMMWTTGRER
jgi:hypothetical protein